mmetsp:Transcript_87548/g.137115  ORF Transcript_87548/g.137115 Transcript_87548/m.137115 type:complete len:641 (-) Transcript_87548:95-2017(-)
MSRKKTCYYELLGVDRKCEPSDVKAAYRKLALKMHPDKASVNNMTVEEATSRFQQIQEAYSTLSDPQERAWYDAHREQILKGDDEPGEDPFKTRINLYKYFSAGCYDGFHDGANGFFTVYAELFRAIDKEEEDWEDADEEHVAMPAFGRSDSDWTDVAAFYKHWLDFSSRKAFGHADKWNTREAQSRQVRRAMEQENKKARQVAKKEFNGEVRQIVQRIHRRDPRVIEHQKQQMKETVERTQKENAEKEQRKKTEAKERQEKKEAARKAEEERWAEMEAARNERRARGEAVSEDDEASEQEAVEFNCEACRKTFKSEAQYDQHTRSKKHLQAVQQFRKELERNMKEEKAESVDEDEEETSDACSASSSQQAVEGTQSHDNEKDDGHDDKEADSEESDDDDDDDDDAMLARLVASKKKQNHIDKRSFSPPARESGEEDAQLDDVENHADAANLEDSGSKKAQKRAKQKAILIEKKKEKEQVQELVNGVRKGQKAVEAKEESEVCLECSFDEKKKQEDSSPIADLENLLTQKTGTLRKMAKELGCTDEQLEQADDADNSKDAFIQLIVKARTPSQAKAANTDRKAAKKNIPAQVIEGDPRCAVCGEDFPSRSKLHQHLRDSGHAAPQPAPELLTKGGKKKKR